MCKNAVLSSFAAGKQTATVLDMGGGGTTVSAVHDGYVLQKAIVRWQMGGDVLTEQLHKVLAAKGEIRPHYSIDKKEVSRKDGVPTFKVTSRPGSDLVHQSYKQWAVNSIVADAKEQLCRVSDVPFDEASTTSSNVLAMSYELPDGNTIEVGAERYAVTPAEHAPRSRSCTHLLSLEQSGTKRASL